MHDIDHARTLGRPGPARRGQPDQPAGGDGDAREPRVPRRRRGRRRRSGARPRPRRRTERSSWTASSPCSTDTRRPSEIRRRRRIPARTPIIAVTGYGDGARPAALPGGRHGRLPRQAAQPADARRASWLAVGPDGSAAVVRPSIGGGAAVDDGPRRRRRSRCWMRRSSPGSSAWARRRARTSWAS